MIIIIIIYTIVQLILLLTINARELKISASISVYYSDRKSKFKFPEKFLDNLPKIPISIYTIIIIRIKRSTKL